MSGISKAALSALKPLTYDPREPHQFMAGLGSYKNKRAVALGYARYYNESKLAYIGMAQLVIQIWYQHSQINTCNCM